VRPYFERASVVMAPVRMGGGMRLKVLQALALGKPLVTTSRGVEGLLLDGNRPLVQADDSDGLAAGAASLLGDAAKRRRLGARARKFAAVEHSADAYARRLEATYAEVAG
jgi:glycosyltransferase involved in cell wall biosynthesis